jgi:2-C-methyl-D-erythritol 4-phosphate cytidylyltransferase
VKAFGLIVAGGHGKRMGAEIPKQLLELNGKTIIEHTLAPFMSCKLIDGIIISASLEIIERIEKITNSLNDIKPVIVIEGGKERQDSVLNGINAVPSDTDIIVIHDAVRPFITADLITECIITAEKHGSVSVMRPIKETVKIVSNGVIEKTLDRSKLWITQTPQAFRTEIIKKAHEKAKNDNFMGTDDCILVERIGLKVHVIEGSDKNIKITTPADLIIADSILSSFNK